MLPQPEPCRAGPGKAQSKTVHNQNGHMRQCRRRAPHRVAHSLWHTSVWDSVVDHNASRFTLNQSNVVQVDDPILCLNDHDRRRSQCCSKMASWACRVIGTGLWAMVAFGRADLSFHEPLRHGVARQVSQRRSLLGLWIRTQSDIGGRPGPPPQSAPLRKTLTVFALPTALARSRKLSLFKVPGSSYTEDSRRGRSGHLDKHC